MYLQYYSTLVEEFHAVIGKNCEHPVIPESIETLSTPWSFIQNK